MPSLPSKRRSGRARRLARASGAAGRGHSSSTTSRRRALRAHAERADREPGRPRTHECAGQQRSKTGLGAAAEPLRDPRDQVASERDTQRRPLDHERPYVARAERQDAAAERASHGAIEPPGRPPSARCAGDGWRTARARARARREARSRPRRAAQRLAVLAVRRASIAAGLAARATPTRVVISSTNASSSSLQCSAALTKRRSPRRVPSAATSVSRATQADRARPIWTRISRGISARVGVSLASMRTATSRQSSSAGVQPAAWAARRPPARCRGPPAGRWPKRRSSRPSSANTRSQPTRAQRARRAQSGVDHGRSANATGSGRALQYALRCERGRSAESLLAQLERIDQHRQGVAGRVACLVGDL